jgi:long-chain acyl-CoA synthetase
VLPETSVKNVITTEIGDLLKFPKNYLVNFVLKNIRKMVPPYSIPGEIKIKSALGKRRADEFKPVKRKNSDIAFLQYTGGTTGVSKGAMLTHRNMIANLLQAKAWLTPVIREGQEVIITALPLYHIFSLTANCFTFSFIGGHNILITNPKDIPAFISELKKWKFTAITGVNTLFRALMNHPGFSELDFSALKVSLGGGMAVQKAVAEEWKQKTKVPLIEAYGLTETSPAACINPLSIPEYNGSIGLPISSTEVKILDDDGNELPEGKEGEICIRGPQVMAGYWQKPEETAKVMTPDGFFKSGDIGFMNAEGYIKIMDRKKDMILVSGFNVYPNEVEDVLATHPKVLEVAAVGEPDAKSGEVVKVFIVKKDASLSSEEIVNFSRDHLAAYKVPRHVEFRDSLPKTNVGKILRKDLRSKAS